MLNYNTQPATTSLSPLTDSLALLHSLYLVMMMTMMMIIIYDGDEYEEGKLKELMISLNRSKGRTGSGSSRRYCFSNTATTIGSASLAIRTSNAWIGINDLMAYDHHHLSVSYEKRIGKEEKMSKQEEKESLSLLITFALPTDRNIPSLHNPE